MPYRQTQTSCRDGKLYIAPVMDCFGGEIISLAMDGNMKKRIAHQGGKGRLYAAQT